MPSLFDKEKTETAETSVAVTPEAEPDNTANDVKEKLQVSVDAAAEYLDLMVQKAVNTELALSKIVAINNDTDDDVAMKLLVKNKNTYNDILKMREEITKPLDEIKELAMRPEKRISILANQPNSTFNRVKRLRDAYANAKLKQQQAEKAAADRKKAQGEEIIRLKGEFETRFYNNVIDALTTMENNIVAFFASLTVDNFDERIKKFNVKPAIKSDLFETWFTIAYDRAVLDEKEFKEFIDQVRTQFTYESINAIYVEKAEAKMTEWKAKLPAKKQELIDQAELAKKDAAAAKIKQDELDLKLENERKQREADALAAKDEKAAEVTTAQKEASLDNEFDHLKVTQNQEQLKNVVKKRVATLDCEPKSIVEVISKMIYTLYTHPVPNPTLHLKKDRSGVILPADENGRPIYESWLEDLLTKFAATGVTLQGIKVDEFVGTVQKAK